MAQYSIQLYKGSRPVHYKILSLEEDIPENLVTKVLLHYIKQLEIDLYQGDN